MADRKPHERFVAFVKKVNCAQCMGGKKIEDMGAKDLTQLKKNILSHHRDLDPKKTPGIYGTRAENAARKAAEGHRVLSPAQDAVNSDVHPEHPTLFDWEPIPKKPKYRVEPEHMH